MPEKNLWGLGQRPESINASQTPYPKKAYTGETPGVGGVAGGMSGLGGVLGIGGVSGTGGVMGGISGPVGIEFLMSSS